MTVNVNV